MEQLMSIQKYKNYKNSTISFGLMVNLLFLILSILVSILILFDSSKPSYYSLLFVLPLTYGLSSLIFNKIFKFIPENLGATLILILFFVRDVLSPLFMVFGNYAVTINLNVSSNTSFAIVLVCYETLIVFFSLQYFLLKRQAIKKVSVQYLKPNITKIYIVVLLLLVVAVAIFQRITPSLLSSYRNVFQINDEFFTNYEDSQVVTKYATSFITKFSLVTGQYLIRILMLLIPSFFIILLSKKKNFLSKLLALFFCFAPLFFIGGAIARSLIYVIVLFFLYNYMFQIKNPTKKTIIILGLASLVVLWWWSFRGDSNGIDMESFSRRFSAYFSGVNVVSGTFNLPQNIEYKIRYFFYDFTSTMPYGNTIFGISNDTIQPFFNSYNSSYGQIPTTIGMGYYYFGPLLAPLYSVVFTSLSVNCSKKVMGNNYGNPFRCMRLILMIFGFSMGIVMYNIEITMIYIFTIYVPLLVLEKIGYRRR